MTEEAVKPKRNIRRGILLALGAFGVLLLLFAFVVFLAFKTGYVDNYVKNSLIESFKDFGIKADIEKVSTTISPTTATLENLQFFDEQTGEKLAKIDRLKLDLTISNLLALRDKRTINVNSTDVEGLEVWVKFDENGKSNFSNLKFKVDEDPNLKISVASMDFSLKNALVHYGDVSRKLSGEAKNLTITVEPENLQAPENERRYKFDLNSTKSIFSYDEKPIEPIDITANGVADKNGADISSLKIVTPLGESSLSGTVKDWQSPKYDLKILSTVDLQQTATILPTGATLRGTGNFEGTVTGEGEKYQVNGEIQSESLAANNVYLKALNVEAKGSGEGSIYEAQGKAIAELLTFEDYRIDFPQLIGNVRGNGTDFKWFGELQAAAVKSPNGTLASLFISDAVAEYKDKQLTANFSNLRAGRFSNQDLIAESLQANGIKISSDDGTTIISSPNIRVGSLKAEGTELSGVDANGVTVTNRNGKTDANAEKLRAGNLRTEDADLKNVTADGVKLTNQNGKTDVEANNLQAENVKTADAGLKNVAANGVRVSNQNGRTNVEADKMRSENVQTADADLKNVTANGVKVNNQNGRTNAQADNLRAENLNTKDAKLRNVTANGVNLTNQNGTTDITAKNLQADGVDSGNTKIGNLQAGNVNVKVRGNQTDVVSDNLKIARIETEAAILGSLNIAGVRLKIVQGRIEGSSGDIDAGNVDLRENGKLENAKFYKPVFILEPSGRYRASMDMSLGGGVFGSVKLGAARASVVADNDQIALNNLTADVMEGKVNGNATIALNQRANSKVDADFTNLDLSKLMALQGGQVLPIAGKTTGKANLTFPGKNFKNASGTLVADFKANAGTTERGLVPINGNLGLKATNGLFDIDYAKFNTEKSSLDAKGRFDLSGSNSNLNLALDSSDATEVVRLIKVLNLSDELEQQLDKNELTFAGNLTFNGTLTGNLKNPNVDGRATVDSVAMRNRNLGSINTRVLVSPTTIELLDGTLQESGGGNVAFNLNAPRSGTNNISVQAKLNRVNLGNILAAFPLLEQLPEKIRDINGETSGTLNLTGLPKEIDGNADLVSTNGKVAGEPFDSLEAKATIQKNLVNLEKTQINFGNSFLRLKGTYDYQSKAFDFIFDGSDLQTELLSRLFVNNPSFPKIKGTIQTNGVAKGNTNDFASYYIRLSGAGSKITINENEVGGVAFNVQTENKILSSILMISFPSHQQKIVADIDLGKDNLPLTARTEFYQTELAPFIALFQTPESVAINGKATGKIDFGGNLYDVAKKAFTTDDLRGTANFSEFALQISDTPFAATQPISISFNTREAVVENARFAGAGANVVVSGTKALNDNGINSLSLDGKINLRLLNALSKNTFYSGLADVAIRLTGPNKESRLSGSAVTENSSISAFVGSQRLNFERIKCRVLFTLNQAQAEQCVGYLGGGKVVGSGGALVEGLQLQQFRLALQGQNITAPLPKDFLTTGDAEVTITGKREPSGFNTLIDGTIYAKRSNYNKEIDLADLIGSRQDANISQGAGSNALGIPQLKLRLIGRDALVVRNNLADLTASVDILVTGDVDFPILTGRITANSGTVFYRSDRYTVNRGTLEFPPQTNGEPVINLQAESEIKGYQVFVNLAGPLSEIDNLTATVRSNPALPQADVVSLITTGSLANTESGIPTYAQSGINTAAEVITDSLINNPVRKATDRLFGLNKFEIDPIISGKRLNPSARLTVGRQINNNLAITYSTNLSEDQNQVLAFEYRVSNRLTFVAQYEQRSLSNVTRNNNNFSFEIRLRRRF